MTVATEIGTDLLDGKVYGVSPMDDEQDRAAEVAVRFACTPVYRTVPRGKHLHVGDGIFLRRCPECDIYVRSYAAILYVPAFDRHLREAHGIDPGPMLPPAQH